MRHLLLGTVGPEKSYVGTLLQDEFGMCYHDADDDLSSTIKSAIRASGQMLMLPERLDYLWFLGFGLDGGIPDHSMLSKARARWRQPIQHWFIAPA